MKHVLFGLCFMGLLTKAAYSQVAPTPVPTYRAVPASSITGTISAPTQIGPIPASQITGNFPASQISGLYPSAIVPTNTSQATFGGSVLFNFPNGITVGGGAVSPSYDLSGNPLSVTLHSIRVTGTVSATATACGPFSSSFCATVTLPVSLPFSSVTTSATSFDCGGGESLAANSYWLHDYVEFAVEWNSITTLYVISGAASTPFAFTCGGV